MANNIYPLIYKPGIKRDGSLFQSEYCTNGQWIRFQRGNIRKIGGMTGANYETTALSALDTSAIFIMSDSENNRIIVYSFKLYNLSSFTSERKVFDVNMQQVGYELLQNPAIPANSIIQFEPVIQNNNRHLVALMSIENALNINTNGTATICSTNLTNRNNIFTALANPPNRDGLSGMLFASNYLFVYGSNGSVQWSRPNNPLDFSNPGNRQITISTDKVICAKSIRGGINNPAILFWTMSSVVKCINNPTANTPADTLAFSVDVISKSSSILSTRCVVEYDGQFFWPGTNRFYHYNGLVDKLPNTLNQNYFFDNLDMTYRQGVFGVKNTQYDEIWWFYPEKPGTPGKPANVPIGQTSRAIIYNVVEKCWYDTAISRACGVYFDDNGSMFTYGRSLAQPALNYFCLYKHESDINSSFTQGERSGNQDYFPLISTFTTPVISWAAFNAMKQFTGVNRWVNLISIEPDFTLMIPGSNNMTVIINTRQYPHSFPVSSPPFNVPAQLNNGQNDNLAKLDVAWQGRYISLTFSTTFNFEMGQVMLELGVGDGQ